jgi:hypothetical protein
MRHPKKSTGEPIKKVPKHNLRPDRPKRMEQEAADFFANAEEDSVRERYAYQTVSMRALCRR